MTRHVDELLHYMQVFARQATNEWSRGFARSILRQARKPAWRPTAKQQAVMNRMVNEMFVTAETDDGFDVVE